MYEDLNSICALVKSTLRKESGIYFNTFHDIHYNKIKLAHLSAALYYYFFDYLNFKPEFPYINIGSHFVNHTGNMIYNEANFGVFALPITWVSLILFKKRFVEKTFMHFVLRQLFQ